MTQNPSPQTLTSEDKATSEQSVAQDGLNALQESTIPNARAVENIKPSYPNWPTSRPGPRSTPAPGGMRSINAIRSEQVKEPDNNQESSEVGTLSLEDATKNVTTPDQPETGQRVLKKRKERL